MKWMATYGAPLCILAASCAVLVAQDVKPAATGAKAEAAPVLSELDALKLDKVVLGIENLQLKLAQGQVELDKLKSEAQAFVGQLQKPGYQVTRDNSGRWVYQAADAATAKPADAPSAPKAPEKK